MHGKIFITSTGYDPQLGRHVKDPYLGPQPSLGGCHADIRRVVRPGDHIFVISGSVRRSHPHARQMVFGAFEVAEKISALEAYYRFPERRLRHLDDGQLDGNVLVDGDGNRHPLDTHADDAEKFLRRLPNYIVGRNPVVFTTDAEFNLAREETLPTLCRVFEKLHTQPARVIGRGARNMSERQVADLLSWMEDVKRRARDAGREAG